ncbi:hypothetical protein [Actinokineospora sp. NBRC 105648]|uniref:hypothetical protein n=1 Tax=Actinokineospora sp. NBRC 105648 TaxID=3032206 RepID=UPI0024A23FBD|nr:hypothetical protein [Actinokineospora sp. NBRC 105648]GLZ40999.1 hypothetical protein Acsp05_46230 [Actinokineospora sp. NBRC 105648]
MRRYERVGLILAAFLALAGTLVLPGTASADRLGGLLVTPGESVDQVPVRLTTEKGCPQGTTGYLATMRGHGLEDVVIVPTSDVLLSHNKGFVVPVANTFRDYADENKTTLQGRYDITLRCIDSFSQQVFGEFTASVEFTGPARYAAVGAAKGPPRNTDPIIPPDLGKSTEPGAPPVQQPPAESGAPLPEGQVAPQPATDMAAPAAAEPGGGSNGPFLYVAGGVAAVVLLTGAAVALRRRGKATPETETE